MKPYIFKEELLSDTAWEGEQNDLESRETSRVWQQGDDHHPGQEELGHKQQKTSSGAGTEAWVGPSALGAVQLAGSSWKSPVRSVGQRP